MLVYPHTLSLITTHACTAACDHCCFGCSPEIPLSKSIPVERMRGLIDEAAELPSIRVVVFTGGECFMLGRSLDDLVGHAAAQGMVVRCVTNGYWARSPQAAVRRLGALHARGLRELNLSTGTFHSRYVPVSRIVDAALAGAELRMTVLINAEIFEGSDFDITAITGHPRLGPAIADGLVLLRRNVWMSNEWGREALVHGPEFSRFTEGNKTGCQTVLNVLSVTPTQDLVACCGLTQELIPELHLGSVRDATIPQLLADTPDDLLKIWIHVEGPERVLEFVKRHQPDYRLPIESVHPCQTCLHLTRDEVAKQVLREHYREKEAELLPLYFAGLTQRKITETPRLGALTADH